MITIHPPEINRTTNKTIVSVIFEQSNGQKDELWYSLSPKYDIYIVTEQLDAFFVALLFLGLKTGQNIKLLAPISAKLFYTTKHYLIDALCFSNPEYIKIKIFATGLNNDSLKPSQVSATGLSCGVDSLATYYDHLEDEKPYAIEYFTFFNVGSHGDMGGEKARIIFKKRLNNILDFANDLNKEVITIDSNLSEILNMKFQQTYNLRTISCALILQKLFRNYYYSSGTRFDHFSFNYNEIADLDMLIIPNLSTETTSFFVTSLKYNRIERTSLISNFSDTYKYLDVCTHPYNEAGEFINCSKCYKCNRTMLTLDLLGKLKNYSHVFNVDLFYKEKEKYIGWLLSRQKKLTLDKELIEFLKIEESITLKSYFYAGKYYIYRQIIKIKKQLLRK